MNDFIQITDIKDPRLDIYNTRKEAHLIHMYEPDPGIFIVESEKCILRALQAKYPVLSVFLEDTLRDHILHDTAAHEPIVRELLSTTEAPVFVASHEVIKQVTGYNLTSGMLCAFRRRELPTIGELCSCPADSERAIQTNGLPLEREPRRLVVLDDVENPTNVGAIFRNAAALNADAVLLAGGCSDPFYRRSSRVSMGTVFQVPWTYAAPRFGKDKGKITVASSSEIKKEDTNYIGVLHRYGFKTVAMALTDRSVNIDHPALKAEEKLAIIMGNEGEGLPQETIDACDYTVCIPMTHGVDSLNVAAASAVAIWELCK